MIEKSKEDEKSTKEEAEDKVRRQLMRDAKPLKITNAYLKHPVKFISGSVAVILTASAIAYWLKYFEYTHLSPREFMIFTDEKVIAWDKRVVAEEYFVTDTEDGEDSMKPLKMTQILKWNPALIF